MVCRTAAIALAATLAVVSSFATARATELETVLREVVGGNPALAIERAMAEAARHRIAPAGAWPAPMLEAGVMNLPESGRYNIDPMTMKMLGGSQRLPLSGRLGLSRRAAREAARAQEAMVDETELMALGAAWEAYQDAYWVAQIGGAAGGHEGLLERLVAAARASYSSGRGRLEDVARAEAERARTLADHASWIGEEHSARARLDALRGETPGTLADSLAAPPPFTVPDDPEPWIGALETTHPRLRAHEAEIAQHRLEARAARRMIWPDLEVRAAWGVRDSLIASIHSGGGIQENMFSVTMALMLPVFAGQREIPMAREMEAMARVADAERRRAELELIERIASAHAEALASQRVVQLLADTVLAAQRRAVEAAWSSYRSGQTDLARVFDATHELHTQQVALLRAHQSLGHAAARFVSLTGRTDLLGVPRPRREGASP